jgi:hypothetical protein
MTPSVGTVEGRNELDAVRNLTAEWHLRHQASGIAMRRLVSEIFSGKTPPRSAYCDPSDSPNVYRAVKVGTLTGSGLNWSVGDRSFARFKRLSPDRVLKLGDIVLTAAAHHPRYIGAKVDVVDCLPAGWEDRCVPSGELLVIRAREDGIDPRALLMWLRTEAGRSTIQACVTGQTAHLHADYVLDVVIPDAVVRANVGEAIELLSASLRKRREFEMLAEGAVHCFGAAISTI